jgi:anti-sigma B factor antagonist
MNSVHGNKRRTRRASCSTSLVAPGRLAVVVDAQGGRRTVRLAGDLDLETAGEVRWLLPRVSGDSVVVDLSRLSFIDAAGISALLHGRHHVEASGRRCTLRGARGLVRRVFDLAGLDHLIEESA